MHEIRPCADEADKAASLAVYNEIWPLDAVTLDEVHSFESGATAFADFIAPGGSAWVGVMPWRPGIGQVLVTILPAHRGRGLGTAFYERVSAWLREHEVDTIDAPIPEDDERSIAFAAKRGFEEVERNGRMLLELTAREPDPWRLPRESRSSLGPSARTSSARSTTSRARRSRTSLATATT